MYIFYKFNQLCKLFSSSYSQSSNLLNQARLRVLKARDEHVSNVLNDSKSKLGDITKDQQKYSQLLQGLIAQVRLIEFNAYKENNMKL